MPKKRKDLAHDFLFRANIMPKNIYFLKQ